jgi:hypothetical protein
MTVKSNTMSDSDWCIQYVETRFETNLQWATADFPRAQLKVGMTKSSRPECLCQELQQLHLRPKRVWIGKSINKLIPSKSSLQLVTTPLILLYLQHFCVLSSVLMSQGKNW